MRAAPALGLALALAGVAAACPARGEAAPHTVVDRAAVRFYSPETGGSASPRFVLERTLAFEARLEAMAATPQGIGGDGYQDRDVRAALEHDVAEEMLASLAEKLVTDSPAAKRPNMDEVARVEQDLSAAVIERLGGRGRIDDAARAERLETPEVDALLRRGALAAWYLDRAVTPILHPSEEQLRDVFRTSAHPYRGRPFEQVKDALSRWFVVERVRVAESAFLQSARARVQIIVTP